MWGRIMNIDVSTYTDENGKALMYAAPSNLSPASEEYAQLVAERVEKLRAADPDMDETAVPVDLVTCSGSGLDPHISPAAAEYQVARIAKANDMTEDEVREIIQNCTDGRFLGIVDLSLAPTPAIGDSVARILEEMGLAVCGTHGTTAALALLNDAVKKGGVMASGHVGGLSGAFIPVSEDEGMIAAALDGTLTIDKLEAMTCVCSVGLDMIAVPGDTTADTISAIIADEAAIGMVNSKTTAVRIIPVEGKTVGDMVEMGGLLGSAPVMPVHSASSADFIARGGRIPAPLQSLKN